MTKIYSLLFVLVVYLGACKTAGKAYNKGNYEKAIELAIKKLQKNPSDGETKALAQNAYRFAVTRHQNNIRALSNSNKELRYEQIFAEYRQLQNLYIKINNQPALASFINAQDYSAYLETFGIKAAEVHFSKGLGFMESGQREDFRKAYLSFKRALQYNSEDRTIRKKMNEAYDHAVVRVVVLPLSQFYNSGYSYSHSYELNNFENEVVRTLRYNINNEFIKFFSEWEARSNNIEPDEILELRLGRMELGRPYDNTQSRTVSKEVVVKETVYKPDSVVKEWARVSAEIVVTRRTLVSDGELYVTARNSKGQILWNDAFKGGYNWQIEFASFRGDERALSESDRQLINNRKTANEPREEEIKEGILEQIKSELTQRMRNIYQRYY